MWGVNALLQTAWEPITPRGVAAFARATCGRLWLVQFLVGLFAASSVVFTLYSGFYPTVREAIRHLPAAGDIRTAKLDWRGPSPVLLAEGHLVAFSIDLDHRGDVRSPAHFQIEFGRETILVHSLFGYLDWNYPKGWLIAFNRPELEPKWGAWEFPILGLAVLVTILWLFLCWGLLATIYAGPVWLVAFFGNRDLRLIECWRLAGAAVLPGAVVMSLAIFLYGAGILDLISFSIIGFGHIVVGWVYLVVSPAFLSPPSELVAAKNPFVPKVDGN